MGRVPLVSVGLPVFNGEAFLSEAVTSLLCQSLTDFELIISDNASTDRTEEICREAARQDDRIRYIRQSRNFGAPENWNFVAREARGHFFKWASDSDVCSPRFLEACVGPLIDDERLVLCLGGTRYIDEAGGPVDIGVRDLETLEQRPSARFRRVCTDLAMNNEQYGVIRTDALLKTRLDRPYPHGDLVLMAELAMLGGFKLLPEVLLTRRIAPGHWARLMSSEQLDGMFWPEGRPTARVVLLRRHFDYLRTALTAPVAWPERLKAAAFALRFAYWKKRDIAEDIVNGLRGFFIPAA